MKKQKPPLELITDPDALMAALHLTVAHEALEEYVSDDHVPMLDDVADDILGYLKKAVGLEK